MGSYLILGELDAGKSEIKNLLLHYDQEIGHKFIFFSRFAEKFKSMSAQAKVEEGSALLPQFEKRGGLLPAIVQEFQSGEILMQGYINQEALEKTLASGYATFWSTSRSALWTKGETSGDYLKIKEILVDCDQDAFIYKVEMQGAGVCHTKNQDHAARKSCFYRKINLDSGNLDFVERLK